MQLQKKYGYTKEIAEKELKNWYEMCNKHSSGHPSSSKQHDISKGQCHDKNAPCKSHDKKHDHNKDHKDKHRKAS